MKKRYKKIIGGVCVAMLSISMVILPVKADDNIKVLLNDQKIEFDVSPQIINDYTMVPVRAIFEALGYDVEWQASSQTILAYSKSTDLFIAMTVGVPKIISGDYTDYINYKQYEGYSERFVSALDISPQIINERTLVPVRAVSEASRCNVLWENNSKTVFITTPKNVGNGTDEEIKDYLRYNYSTMMLNGQPRYMRFNILHNVLNSIPSDYVITVTPVGGVKEIAMLSDTTADNKEKQKIVDAYTDFEKDMAINLISQMPNKKFWGYIANSIGDTYSYFNWTNYENTNEFSYKKTKATSNFYWATKLNYKNFDFKDYFSDMIIESLPFTIYDPFFKKNITITNIEFGDTHATNEGENGDEVFVDLSVTADGEGYFYFNYFDRKGRLLYHSSILTYKGEHSYYELVPKNATKLVISDKLMNE